MISNSHSKISLSINEKCYQISSWIKRKHYPHSFHPPKCHKNKFCTNFSKLIYHFPDEMESNDYLINFSRDWLVCLLIVTWKKKTALNICCGRFQFIIFSSRNMFGFCTINDFVWYITLDSLKRPHFYLLPSMVIPPVFDDSSQKSPWLHTPEKNVNVKNILHVGRSLGETGPTVCGSQK